MLDKFKSLKGSTKALIIVCGVMAVVAIGLIIAVLATGGFSNPVGSARRAHMNNKQSDKEKEISTLKRIRFHLGVCSALCLVPVALCLVALLLEAGII